MIIVLEWIAFGLGAVCVYAYGRSKKWGAILGMIAALVFMLWGSLAGLWGAFTINIGFFSLHSYNLWRSRYVDVQKA